MKMIQQGDCLLELVTEPVKGKKVKPTAKGNVLAEGEATGHSHHITADTTELIDSKGVLYLRVNEESYLEHEEHKRIAIPPGTYRIDRVREWDYLQQLTRRVAD